MLKELFLDRVGEVETLTTGLKGGKDFILIAPRRYGKTTLSQRVLDDIAVDKNYLCMSVDIMRYSGSVQSIAEGVLENCLNMLGIVGKLQLLLKQIDFSLTLKLKFNSLEIEPVLQLVKDKKNEYESLAYSLELIEKIAIKTNKTVVVFFDEFGELAHLGERVIKIFRSVIQKHKRVNYIFAGSQETLMTKIFVDKSGAFYRFGTLLHIRELERKYVIEYLAKLELEFDVTEMIINKFKCHPYYTAQIIKDIMLKPKYGSNMENFLYYVHKILLEQEHSYLELQLLRINELSNALDIMNKIALGIDVYSNIVRSRQAVFKSLAKLEQLGFISKSDGKYEIFDPLLAIYLTL